jgi:L-iditol 2-dehydrogenase
MKDTCISAIWEGVGSIKLIELPIPILKSGEVLLKVEACAICGSDLRTLNHGNPRVKSGQVVGHEIAGTICALADDVINWNMGDRLSVGADVPCGECLHCKSGSPNCCDINYAVGHQFSGGFSEYMVLNALTLKLGPVKRIQDQTDFDSAALAEPLACCINGYERSFMEEGRSVVIFGAGPIGMMLGLLGKSYKPPFVVIIDPNNLRLQQALELGAASHVINPLILNPIKTIMEMTNGNGADMIFTACAVSDTHTQAISMVAKRGVVNLFGGLPGNQGPVALNSNLVHYRECYITGSHGSTPEQHAKAVRLIETGIIPVSSLITHRFPLDEITKAYEMAASGEAIKVVIKPQSEYPRAR